MTTYTRIHEWRIIVPTVIPQYRVGSRYMASRIAREDKGGGEGIEVRRNEPFEDGERRGTYTYKVYHIKSKIPGAIRWAVPESYLHFHEESWNYYPHYSTKDFIPGKEDSFYLHIESQHLPYRHGEPIPDNPVGLTPDELKIRKVTYLDIVGHHPKPEKPEEDMLNFVCPEAGVETPLTEDPDAVDKSKPPKWTEVYPGDMIVACKVVRFRFHWFGLNSAVHSFVMDKLYPKLFTNTHRKLMSWAKDWFPMDDQGLLEYETETERIQRAYFEEQPPDQGSDAPPDGPPPDDPKGKKKDKKDKKKK
jgi:hypothetical protein